MPVCTEIMNLPEKGTIKGILFDLGSTLIEYENIPWDKMNLLALKAGYKYLQDLKDPIPPYEKIRASYIEIRDNYRKHAGETLEEWIVPDGIMELFIL